MSSYEKLPVSVIVAMRNASSTIIPCLDGLASQDYPIAEIIVIDNVSTDNSASLVETFAKRSRVPVRLIKQGVNGGLATSYNMGATMAVSSLLVFAHSDGTFPSSHEIEKLVEPLCRDASVVAACPKLVMPREVWERFPYWQKHLFSRALGRENHSMCGKFDGIRKDAYQKAGGLNAKRFTAACGYGGEDSDINYRIAQLGAVVKTGARVIHLHDLSHEYDLCALFRTRKMLARTYAKILLFQGIKLTLGKVLFFVRPALAILPLIPHLLWIGLGFQLLFSCVNSWRMYTSRSTLLNPRILLLPFVDIALIYHETFWFIEGLLAPPADAKAKV